MSYSPREPVDQAARAGFWAWMLLPAAITILVLLTRGCQ